MSWSRFEPTASRIQTTNFNINLRYPVVFKHYRSNVEVDSTALCAIPGPMSRWTRQHFVLYQVQCRAQIDMLFCCVLCWFSLSSFSQVAAFELWRSEVSWKIYLDQTVWTYKNNLESKVLVHFFVWFQTLPLGGSSFSHYSLHRMFPVSVSCLQPD